MMEQEGQFDFDDPVNRENSSSVKWDKYKGRDILPLWVADMDFRSPPSVIEALKHRSDHGVFGYTVAPEELVRIVISRMHGLYGFDVEPEWIVWLPGLVPGLNLSCRAVGADEDEVLTLIPIYPPFLSAPRHSNRGAVRVPLIQDRSRWEIDFDLLKKSITPRTKLFMLCNPHNPVGRAYSRDELTQICVLCETHDLIICSDEIHCDLYLDQDKKHIPIASLAPEILRRTITLMAPSKTFNLPGLGCSFAMISDPDLRKRFLRAMAGVVPDVNVFGYAAALAAYRDGESWLQALLKYLRSNHSVVEKTLNKLPGLAIKPVEATYLAWVKVDLPGIEDPPVFFEKAGVGLSDGRDFGTPGFVRLNFGCPQSTLVAALGRMESAISTIKK